MSIKFSKANAKLKKLEKLTGKKLYSFDLLSGYSCPYAKDCESRAVETDNGLRVQDGKHTDFRCYSASQEAFYPSLYKLRKNNMEILMLAAQSVENAADALVRAMPKNAEIVRVHAGGDFKTQAYFDAWLLVAKKHPNIVFYCYTKSLPFVVKRLSEIPDNFIITTSFGGWKDSLIEKHNLRYVKVVPDEKTAEQLGLPIDSNDSLAYNPSNKANSFALLIHGTQPTGSAWGKAVKKLKGKGSYRRAKTNN